MLLSRDHLPRFLPGVAFFTAVNILYFFPYLLIYVLIYLFTLLASQFISYSLSEVGVSQVFGLLFICLGCFS